MDPSVALVIFDVGNGKRTRSVTTLADVGSLPFIRKIRYLMRVFQTSWRISCNWAFLVRVCFDSDPPLQSYLTFTFCQVPKPQIPYTEAVIMVSNRSTHTQLSTNGVYILGRNTGNNGIIEFINPPKMSDSMEPNSSIITSHAT